MILVTGGCGYIGSVVAEALLARGYDALITDISRPSELRLNPKLRDAFEASFLQGDLLDASFRARLLDARPSVIIHLAAIVGEAACGRDEALTWRMNHEAPLALNAEASSRGLRAFFFASTCSNYGVQSDLADEDSELLPLSAYAESKVAAERDLLKTEFDHKICVFRFATAHGVSPRMRFDLTVNQFIREMWASDKLEVYDAESWRPYFHTRDFAECFMAAIAALDEFPAREILNVGDDRENHQKAAIAAMARRIVGRGTVVEVASPHDRRDYRVSFARARARLGLTATISTAESMAQIGGHLAAGAWADADDQAWRYRNA